MRKCRPACYDAFHCIGSACTDTCCAGWEIDIDETSYEKYQGLTGAIRERLDREIGEEEGTHFFRLKEGRRCPLLNKDNLCDLFIEAGEEYLCDICTEHPRFYNWFGSDTEVGLGLCCEEAERLLLGSEAPMTFITEEEEAEDEEEEDVLLQPFLAVRQRLFDILQDRSRPILQRMRDCVEAAEVVQYLLDVTPEVVLGKLLTQYAAGKLAQAKEEADCKVAQKIPREAQVEALHELLQFYQGLEALDESWPTYLGQLEDSLEELLDSRDAFLQAYADRSYEYEHLMVYFIYRYFMGGLYTFDVLSGVYFAVVSTLVILLCGIYEWKRQGTLDFTAQCSLIRRYSKEIEYCTENVEAICGMLAEADIYSLL